MKSSIIMMYCREHLEGKFYFLCTKIKDPIMRLINQIVFHSLNWMLHDSCVFVEDTVLRTYIFQLEEKNINMM